MDSRQTKTIIYQPEPYQFASLEDSADDHERLNSILALNADIRSEKSFFRNDREQLESLLMKKPLSAGKTFAYLGLMLGTFPPASIFFNFLQDSRAEIGLIGLLILMNLICAVSGYFAGKLTGKLVSDMQTKSWNTMLLSLPFIGALWGIITGGAGGVLIFVIGAFFGAFIAAIVGSIAITLFAIIHRLLKKGEFIEQNQFIPLASGITFAISAFILGL